MNTERCITFQTFFDLLKLVIGTLLDIVQDSVIEISEVEVYYYSHNMIYKPQEDGLKM